MGQDMSDVDMDMDTGQDRKTDKVLANSVS